VLHYTVQHLPLKIYLLVGDGNPLSSRMWIRSGSWPGGRGRGIKKMECEGEREREIN
jgi:hypothetical protein